MNSPPTKSNAIDGNPKRNSPPTNSNAIDGDPKRIKPSTDAMEGDNQKQDSDEIIKSNEDAQGRVKLGKLAFERIKEWGEGDWRCAFTEDGYLRSERHVIKPRPPPFSHKEAYNKQRLELATSGLKYFNNKINEGVEYELVEPLTTAPVHRGGIYVHGNFLAKPKNASIDTKPKLFFAEMKICDKPKIPEPVLRCSILEPDPRDFDQAPGLLKIYHPQDMVCDWCSSLFDESKLEDRVI